MSRVTSRPRLLLAATIGLAMLLVAETAVLAVTTTKTGGPVKAVKVVTASASTPVTSMTFVDVPGMSVSMTVPSGEKAVLLITYSMYDACFDGDGATTFCYVHVTVDGNEAPPGQVAFDGAGDGNGTGLEAGSMQFVAGPVGAGPHTIKVQARVDESVSIFSIYSSTLSVLRSKV